MEFKLADIGEGMQEAEILKWLVQEGEAVREDQPLVEIQTDKVTVELPSPWRGTVRRIVQAEGSMVTVGNTLVEIEVAGAASSSAAAPPLAPAPSAPESAASPGGAPAAAQAPGPIAAGRRVLAAPATRRRARELGIELADVLGTGPGGRVEPKDLDAHVARPAAMPPVRAAQPAAPRTPAAPSLGPDSERVPLRGLRRVIARNMALSHQEIPQASHLDDCDVTELAALRLRWNHLLAAEGQGERLSYLPFVLRAAAAALRRHPWLNAQYDDAAGEAILWHRIHIGVATDTPDGLIVPVVHDADRRSLRELGREIGRLAAAAREHRLTQQDAEGGTFTITNHGSIGGLYGAPIIRHPEVAILGIGRIRPQAVVRDGEIVARTILHYGVTFDHRVLDGGEVARFAADFTALLENPDRLFLETA